MQTTPGRREKKKAQTRNSIIEAAAKLFSQRGFDQTSIDEICESADVVKGTFYYHFQSKEDLVVELRRDRMKQVEESIYASLAAGVSPLVVLEELMVKDAVWTEQNKELALVFLSQTYMRRAAMLKNREEQTQPEQGSVRRPIFAIVEAAQKAGEMRDDIHAHDLGEMVFSFLVHCKRSWLNKREQNSLVDSMHTWRGALLQGLSNQT
jgi:AcrR family transcriptional regulator